MREPLRRCVGCGRSAPQRDLLRFAARDGALVPGRTEPGRGAYTCRDSPASSGRRRSGSSHGRCDRASGSIRSSRVFTLEEANG